MTIERILIDIATGIVGGSIGGGVVCLLLYIFKYRKQGD